MLKQVAQALEIQRERTGRNIARPRHLDEWTRRAKFFGPMFDRLFEQNGQ
jgi:hypothetical protein